uniref:Uncharacterized protein n=1 Tax=Strongyloides venezuelensis TaxID=75913 RepID=A0A0K0F5R6_STRVS
MRNLETLKMNFKTDRALINCGVMKKLNLHTYEFFKNLSNLKTIYIISDFYRPIGEMNREYTIMNYTDGEFKYFPENTQKIEKYKMNFQNKLMAFLSVQLKVSEMNIF